MWGCTSLSHKHIAGSWIQSPAWFAGGRTGLSDDLVNSPIGWCVPRLSVTLNGGQ